MKSSFSIVNTLFGIITLLIIASPVYGQMPVESDTLDYEDFDTSELEFSVSEDPIFGGSPDELVVEEKESFFNSYIFDPMRFGLKYEMAYKVTKPDRVMNNRLSYRLEYSRSFFDHFSLQVDTKIFTFLKDDHRARDIEYWINDDANEAEFSFGGRTREAFVQASFGKTSIRAGIQTLVWGESDFAIVTNEVSRLDYREPLSLSIDELRIGQPIVTVDHYSQSGDWSAFFTPDPKFNEHPKEGTGYYYEPFNGTVTYQAEPDDESHFEYGLRWKKTFGKSDVSIMAASLINNEYALRMANPELITRKKHRFHMAGVTFNRAISNVLLKGEVAVKAPKAYNDASFQIVEKNALDASLGVDYYMNNSFTVSVEAVNYHIMDWSERIQGQPRNNYMLLVALSKELMKEDLSINLASMYNGPYTTFFNILSTSYNWNDRTTLYFDMLMPFTDDPSSGLYIYRTQKQAVLKIQYQF
ncbi:hypothetical protein JMN32_24795 [Fulvivirga sp. 29W222]|uniref:Uncharacterized protein n=1 Tax=Fulvivirga marina TaxID=2494733 RepID=A0A937KEG0_9BACT|nr:DUF1302 family protein [Fulvivirga marina]MBL6449554.1 hypothetical protein [Fulvivirga marina]